VNADPEPDLGAWKSTKINKLTWFPAIQKGFVPSQICSHIYKEMGPDPHGKQCDSQHFL
jgi:hypothetical protein